MGAPRARTPRGGPHPVLTLRDLNRATLARQMLLERADESPVTAIERLAGLQAQYSPSPYIALWTRLRQFAIADLTAALENGQVFQATLMRGTLHLVSAGDYPAFVTATMGSRLVAWRRQELPGEIDLAELRRRVLAYAAAQPRRREDLVEFLEDALPENSDLRRYVLWQVFSVGGWLVRSPPSGTWRYFGRSHYVAATRWLGEITPPEPDEALAHLVTRYLAAFGPASRADIAAWSGLQVGTLAPAVEALAPRLETFTDEHGRLLVDLADAPRPGSDTAAPVRYLPKWDNLLLGHQRRDRVLPEPYRKTVIRANGDVLPTFLLDGTVAGTWEVKRRGATAELRLSPFGELDAGQRVALEQEGESLLGFMEPGSRSHAVLL